MDPPAEGEQPKEPAADAEANPEEAKPEEATPPVEEPKSEEPKPEEPAVQEYESKERHRQTTSNIKFDTSSHAIPPQTKTDLRALEVQFYGVDKNFLDWKKIRNNLEAYGYDMKNKIDEYGSYFHYIQDSERNPFLVNI